MKINRLRVRAIKKFETVDNLNPNYVKDIFTPKLHPKVRPNDILLKDYNTITYGTKSLRCQNQVILNQRHLIPSLRSILILGSDLNVDVMCNI